MSYLIPREVVELLLHRQHPIRIFKCILYPVWLNRENKRVMFTKMSDSRLSCYPLYEYRRGWCSRSDLFESLGGLWVWRSWPLNIFLVLFISISPLIIVLLLRWLLLIFIFIILSLILILSWWRCLHGGR
jgi:hypothetical protein